MFSLNNKESSPKGRKCAFSGCLEIHPYRTSAFWGRCPACTPPLQLITSSRASGTADHVRSLDNQFFFSLAFSPSIYDFFPTAIIHVVCIPVTYKTPKVKSIVIMTPPIKPSVITISFEGEVEDLVWFVFEVGDPSLPRTKLTEKANWIIFFHVAPSTILYEKYHLSYDFLIFLNIKCVMMHHSNFF